MRQCRGNQEYDINGCCGVSCNGCSRISLINIHTMMLVVIRPLNLVTITLSWKERGNKVSPSHRLILTTFFVSLMFYLWKSVGCPGVPNCYICRPFSTGAFLPDVTFPDEPASTNREMDFGRLMNLDNFTFLKNVSPCDNSSRLILLVLIHSYTMNFEKRSTIRHTWGSIVDARFKLVFLLGATMNSSVQAQVDWELKVHGDIVQGNFIDAYRNLTYKHVMSLKWAKYFCSSIRYVLKTDDDVFINMPKFLDYIQEKMLGEPESKVMRCLPERKAVAYRTTRSKWKVTWSEYEFKRYPPFCQGFVILYSSDVISGLYSLAQGSRYFWIDDVFVTGILAAAYDVQPQTFGRLMMDQSGFRAVMVGSGNVQNYLIGFYNLQESDIIELWKKALDEVEKE